MSSLVLASITREIALASSVTYLRGHRRADQLGRTIYRRSPQDTGKLNIGIGSTHPVARARPLVA